MTQSTAAEAISLPQQLFRSATEDPHAVLIREVGGRDHSRHEFWREANDWADYLGSSLGVSDGETVLVMQPSSARALALWTGIALLRAIEVPANTELRGTLLDHLIGDSRARVAIVDERYVELLATATEFESLRTVLVTGTSTAPQELLSRNVDVVAIREPPATTHEITTFPAEWDTACLLYTSGTTGRSKGVVVPWGQLWETTMGTGPERTLRVPSTVFYSPYPTYHVSGKTPLYATLLGGGSVVLRERFDTGAFWDDVRQYECTFTLLLASTANFVLRRPPADNDADNPLVGVLFSPWIPGVQEFRQRFSVEAYSVYNMTEISCPIVGGWDDEPIDPAVCGWLRPGFHARVVDAHDRDVPPGSPGELVLRTDRPWRLTSGYWHRDDATVAAWRNQWFHTGDIFVAEPDGRFRYIDRLKDSIRRRGENISSAEVEAAALRHPGVEVAAAVAVPDDISEEEVKLVVTPVAGSDLDEKSLHAFLSHELPRFMVPRYLEFVSAVPRTATQKIRKAELRSQGLTPTTWDRKSTDRAVASNLHLEDVVIAGLRFPEGPCWTPNETLVMVDLAARQVLEVDGDRMRVLANSTGSPNGAALTDDGRILVADNGGRWPATASTDEAGGSGGSPGRLAVVTADGLETVLSSIAGIRLDAPNDVCVDSSGGMYVTDPHWGERPLEATHHGAVCYVAPTGEARRCATGIRFPNGVCLAPDERWLYVSETRTGTVLRAEISEPGALGPWMPWAQLGEDTSPDGMCVDESGTLLVAGSTAGAVFVIDPHDPQKVSTITSQDRVVTNVCFGGEDLRTLYVTEASLGRVTRLRWDVPGAPLRSRTAAS